MISFAIWLAGFSFGDVVASDLGGRPQGRRRIVVGALLGAGSAAVLASLSGLSTNEALLVIAGVLITGAAWLAVKFWQAGAAGGGGGDTDTQSNSGRGTPSARIAVVAIGVFFASVLIMLVVTNESASASRGLLARYLDSSSIPQLATLEPETAVWLGAVVLFFLAPCNALVRLTLDSVGTPVVQAQQSLRGGRLIGPLERLLIFGLALAGAPTAAALVISAKGLLRFPELNGIVNQRENGNSRRIDEVTEYLLVGSLVSWLLALLPLLVTP